MSDGAWCHYCQKQPCVCDLGGLDAAERRGYARAVADAAKIVRNLPMVKFGNGTDQPSRYDFVAAIESLAPPSAGPLLPTTPCPRCDNMILFELCCESGCQRPAPSLDVAGVQRAVARLESAKRVSSETMSLCVGDPPSPGYAEAFAAGAWQRMKLAVIDVLHDEFNKMPYSASQAVFVETVSAAIRALPLPTPEGTP